MTEQRLTAAEIARRSAEAAGKPCNMVIKTAATACELANAPSAEKPKRLQR